MSKVRFLVVGAGAALALGTAGVLASVGAVTLTNSDSHGTRSRPPRGKPAPTDRMASTANASAPSHRASLSPSLSRKLPTPPALPAAPTTPPRTPRRRRRAQPKTPLRTAPTPPRLPTRRKASPRRLQPRRRTSRNERRVRRQKRRTDSQGGGGNMTWAVVS